MSGHHANLIKLQGGMANSGIRALLLILFSQTKNIRVFPVLY